MLDFVPGLVHGIGDTPEVYYSEDIGSPRCPELPGLDGALGLCILRFLLPSQSAFTGYDTAISELDGNLGY